MVIIVLAAFLLCGCASLQPPEAPDTLPRLVYQVPLPPWPRPTVVQDLPLELMIRVAVDGSVSNASLVATSGSREWDTLALAAVRQWRYSPARIGANPVATWIRQKVRVHFEAPALVVLCELACNDQGLADSLYALLRLGAPFDSLARRYSVFASRERGGFLGEIDIRAFPEHVRRQVGNLHVGDITKPLLLGENLMIYKRLGRVR